MTPEEHKMIKDLHEKVDKINSAFFDVPHGSGPKVQPLITEIREVVLVWKRASWITKGALYVIPAAAALGAGWDKIIKFMHAIFKV